MEVAAIKHAGPAKDYSKTYGLLGEWMAQNNYEWTGPAFEVYTKKPKARGGETIIYAEVRVPVRKKNRLGFSGHSNSLPPSHT